MKFRHRIASLFRNLFRKRETDQDLKDELRSYLDLLIEKKIENGIDPEEARRRSLIELGGAEQIKEKVREIRMGRYFEVLLQDLRYSLRMLGRSPVFTGVALLSLALGIGANTAVFSVVNTLLLRPYPFPSLGRIMLVRESRPADDVGQGRVAPADFLDLKSDKQVFDQVSAWTLREFNLTGTGEPEHFYCSLVTSNFFDLLGVRPEIGRNFLSEEEQDGRDQVVIVSHSFWQQRLGQDPNVAGKPLQFNGRTYTVAGVMPQEYKYPPGVDIWAPLSLNTEDKTDRTRQSLRVMGRLAPGVTQDQAQAKMQMLAGQLEQQYPTTNANRSITLIPLRQEQYSYTAPLFLTLQAAAAFVLLLACVNVANLLLARAIGRQKEIAIRLAMGANRWRLFRLFICETIILSIIGGVTAIILSLWSVPIIRNSMPEGISKYVAGWTDIRVDVSTLGFTLLVVLGIAVLFGIGSTLQTSRLNVAANLKDGNRGSGAGNTHHRLRSALVIAEIVLSIVLLVGAGLTIKGFQNLVNVFQGFAPSNVLTFGIALPSSKYSDNAKIVAFYEQTLQAISSLGRVESVGIISNLPASNVDSPRTFFTIEERPALVTSDLPGADVQTVNPDILKTLRIPIVQGRMLSEQDGPDAARTVVISQTMAERFWPNEVAIGKRIKLGAPDSNSPWLTIVGVAGNFKQNWFDAEARSVLYCPYSQSPQRSLTFVIRTTGDPISLVPDVRAQVWKVDATQPISGFHSMQQEIDDAVAPIRIIGLLMVVFGILSLILSLIGVYGVLAYYVTDRRHEFGVRLALGAEPQDILKLIFKQASKLSLIGLAIGLPVAILFGRVMASALYGVVTLDAFVFAGLTFLVLLAVLAASCLPARNAMKSDPMSTLREE